MSSNGADIAVACEDNQIRIIRDNVIVKKIECVCKYIAMNENILVTGAGKDLQVFSMQTQ